MLDNEPNENTEAAETAAPVKATRKRATKRTAKKAVPPPEAAVSTQSDAADADPAPEAGPEAAKQAAGKTAKKAAAKTAAKRTSRKATTSATAPEIAPVETGPAGSELSDTGQQTLTGEPADQAPARKTTRKRTTKKAAAPQPDLLSADAPQTDGPVADATPAQAAQPTNQPTNEPTAESTTESNPGRTAEPTEDAPAETAGPRRRTRRAAPPATVLFQAPQVPVQAETPAEAPQAEPAEQPEQPAEEPARPSRRTRKSAAARRAEAAAAEAAEDEAVEAPPRQDKVVAKAGTETDADTEADTATDVDAESDSDSDGEGEGSRRRRRRRGGRRRRKGGEGDGADDSADEHDDADDHDRPAAAESDADRADQADQAADEAGSDDEDGEGGSSSRRRRRRRRRKGEDSASAPDDPDETVVRVREPRSKNTANEITAIEGSTRMEAKKQRRREGRAAGRRRAPIVSEAEFLARRESVERTMVIRARDDLTQIAVSEDNVLVEHYVAQAEQSSLIGNVYLGRVQNVLPSMEAAFIDIGKGRNAVLYAGEVDWATLGGANGPRKIESVLKSGQSVLVQVTKDPIGHKGARLTNQISLPGRYVVYVPRGGNGGISRKLPDTERNRLKGILKDIVPDEAGVIVRTAAEGASEEELTHDVSRLKSYWDDIEKKSKNGQSPQLLYGEPDLLIRVVRDLFTEDFAKLVISGHEAFGLVNEYVSYVAPHLADRVEKWNGDGDVFSNYRIDEQIKKALDRKVWLPSGGSLIIDRTEAMTVVDVNTGKFTGSGGNLEETVTRNNLEAAEEIVRQLRLRDIGGIIVVDFIDMVLESNRDLVLRRLVECLGRDRTKHQVAEVTSLGLVQMTRKRIGTGLLEAFSENCDHCGGRGLILHDEPKEPRKRSEGGGQSGDGQAAANGSGSGGGGKAKSSRSGRGRGRGKGKQEAAEEPQETPGDAAQRVAEIAAASGRDKAENDAQERNGRPDRDAGDSHDQAQELAVAPV